MAANLGLDHLIDRVRNLPNNATGFASNVITLFERFRSDANLFGSAALRDTGTDEGNIPVLGAHGRINAGNLPIAGNAEATAGTANDQLMTPAATRAAIEAVVDTGPPTLTIAGDTRNFSVALAAGLAGFDMTSALEINIIIRPGVIVGSATTDAFAFDTRGLPAGSWVNLTIGAAAYIVGAGGRGGSGENSGGKSSADAGGDGGPALRCAEGVTMRISNLGTIAGGGGGGGGGVGFLRYSAAGTGGGGAGDLPGTSVRNCWTDVCTQGRAGTLTRGGDGVNGSEGSTTRRGGNGGNLGQPGRKGNGRWGHRVGGPGGAAGTAITGASRVTLTGEGEVLGPTTE